MSIELGELYASARGRIAAIAVDLPREAAELNCPATPEWTVHDVLAHLRGSTEDIRTGNLEGVTTEPWTAAQIERHRTTTTADLLTGWAEDSPLLEFVLSSPEPGIATRAVFDVHAHEADLRGALGYPAALSAPFAEWALPLLSERFLNNVQASRLPDVQIITTDGDVIGSGDASVVLRVSRFELFRSLLGRRSPAQVAVYDWGSTDPTPYLEHFFIFGPRSTDLVE